VNLRFEIVFGAAAREEGSRPRAGIPLLDGDRFHFLERREPLETLLDAILHEGYRREQPLEPDLRAAYETLKSSDHVVLIFPLWCGDMPAMLKGFIERILQPDLIARENTENARNWHIFANKTARIVMTMDMPVSIYRWWYGGYALKLLTRNILHFIGIKPVRHTLYGMIGTSKPATRERWLREIEALGKAAN